LDLGLEEGEVGFLDALKKSLMGGGQAAQQGGYVVYVRCRRCGEVIRTRINLSNDLSEDEDGNYTIHKTLVGGARRCYARLEMSLVFDSKRQLLSREVSGGEFVTEAEFDAAAAEEVATAEEAAAAKPLEG
jgi:hypothetical protein